jgi:hypothetical protein
MNRQWCRRVTVSWWLLQVCVAPAEGYEVDVHRALSELAVDRAEILEAILRDELNFSAGRKTLFVDEEARIWVGLGSRQEDVPDLRVFNHFHNPLLPSQDAGLRSTFLGLTIAAGQSSLLWQQNPAQAKYRVTFLGFPVESGGEDRPWQRARREYLQALMGEITGERDQAFRETFLGLGHVMHLIQDSTVPAHVRNDPHPTKTFRLGQPDELRIPIDPDPYEDWVMHTLRLERTLFNELADGTPPGGMPDLSAFSFSGTPVSEAPVPIARLLDTGGFRAASNPAGLADTALVGIAEYTNGNYLSKDTVFRRFAHPAVSSLGPRSADPDLFVAQPGGGFRQYFAKETAGAPVRPFVMEGPLHQSLQAVTGLPPGFGGWFFDDKIHEAYARKLLPRAVAYSTALLDYFFRGKLDVDVVPDAVDPTLVRIEGKNASPEMLDGGTLSLYADVAMPDPAGVTRFVRQPATAVGSDLTVTAAPDAPVRSAPFQAPAQAERFVAVYKGKLGEERPNLDPPVDNPGAVIGKVLGGLRVEHVFPDFDSGFWMLRSPAGVFPLPISIEDIVTLRWGDADNTLVGRTAFGRLFGEPNQIASFEILRPEGATEVPLQNGVVRLVERARVSVPFGLALGTTVELTHGIQFEQKLVTFRHEESFVNAQRTENSFSHLAVETFTDSKVLAASWNLSLDFDKFTASTTRPYTWRIPEVALRRDGTILALVQVTLTAPTDPNSFATFATRKYVSPAPGCGFPCEAPVLQPGNNVGVPYAFPQSFNAVGYVVDVTNGRVLHSTAPPVVSFAHTTRATRWNDTSPNFAATEFHWVTRVDTSTEPATVVTGYDYDSGNNQRGAFCAQAGGFVQFDAIHANEGTTFLGAVRFRPEIAAKDALPSFEAVVRQDRFCVGADGATTFGYDVTTDAPRRQLAIFHFETRARAAGEPDRLVFEIEEPQVNPSDVFARIVFWDPVAGVATMHRVSTRETANIVSVGRDAAWFHASTTSIYVPREEGTLPTTFQIDFDPSLAFRVLADKRLYSADTLRFHALDPALGPTVLPAVLPGGGNRSGDFHTIPLK